MKKVILIFMLVWAYNLNAQEFNVNITPSFKVQDDVTNFHKYGNAIYSDKINWGNMQFALTATLKKVTYGIEFTKYDENLKVLKELTFAKKNELGPFMPIIHYGKDAIFVIYFKFKDEDNLKMLVSKINLEDLNIVATKEIMELNQKNKGLFGTMDAIEDAQVRFRVSEDKNNFWAIYANPNLISSTAFDNNLNITQKPEFTSVNLKSIQITSTYFDNNGNKVLAYNYDKSKGKDLRTQGLYFLSPNTKGSITDVKLTNINIPSNLTLKKSEKSNKLLIAGHYFENNFESGAVGVFLANVEFELKSINNPTFTPYTNEIKKQISDLGYGKKRNGEITIPDETLTFNINETEDGTVVLSGKTSRTTSGTDSKGNTITRYFSGPIIYAFINSSGKANFQIIPIKQSFGSFLTQSYKNKIITIYTDNPDNDRLPIANTYDSEGKLLESKLLIDNPKLLKGHLMLSDLSKFEGNKFIIPVGKDKANMVKFFTRVNQLCYIEIK
mgnify:CR=1 FL=1